MAETDVAALTRLVLGAGFALSALFGAIVHRTQFCSMGAVADVVNLGDWTRARQWALAAGVAMLGFNTMVALGWLQARDSFYADAPLLWLSALVGGLLFGFGMVLASGCGSKTLVRVGSGNLKALVVLLVMAVAALLTLRGVLAVVRVHTLETVQLSLPTTQDLPSLLAQAGGWSRTQAALLLGALLGGGLVAWALARAEGREANSLLAGLGLGGVVVAVWWMSGRLGLVEEHPQTLERMFLGTASGEWLGYFSDTSRRLTLGVVSVAGVLVGAFADARLSGRFRWEGFRDVSDLGHHLVGAVLMGVGGVAAGGCTVGQGMSGLSTLALGSFVAVAAIVGGAALGVRYQAWRVARGG
jgi:uncharacterized protein